MSFILRLLGGTAGPYIAGAVGAIVLVSVGTATVEMARVDNLKGALATEQAAFKQEHQSFLDEKGQVDTLTKARNDDHKAAVADATQAQTQCDARVASARKSASAIKSLLNKAPANAPQPGTPAAPGDPELIPGEQLWNAIRGQTGQSAPAR